MAKKLNLTLAAILAATFMLVGGLAESGGKTACMEDQPCWNCATMGNRICGK